MISLPMVWMTGFENEIELIDVQLQPNGKLLISPIFKKEVWFMAGLSNSYICRRCGKTKAGMRHRDPEIESVRRLYVCPKCYNIINESILKEDRETRRIEVIKQTSQFNDYLENCEKNG